jgi:hypothetical protein
MNRACILLNQVQKQLSGRLGCCRYRTYSVFFFALHSAFIGFSSFLVSCGGDGGSIGLLATGEGLLSFISPGERELHGESSLLQVS